MERKKMFWNNAVVVESGGMKICFRDWSWNEGINLLSTALTIRNDVCTRHWTKWLFLYLISFYEFLRTKWSALRTHRFYFNYVRVFSGIHFFVVIFLLNEPFSLGLLYVYVFVLMQVFGVLQRLGPLDFEMFYCLCCGRWLFRDEYVVQLHIGFQC